MIFAFFENEYCTSITLTPETPLEVSQLARFTKNSKSEKPTVTLQFSDTPYCNIHFQKLAKNNQVNSIENKKP